VSDRVDLRAAIKTRDTWWPTVFSGPVANRIVGLLAPYDAIQPNHVTLCAMAVAVAAALCLYEGQYPALLLAAVLVQFAFILDCADGQLARHRGTASPFGAVLDRVFDRVKQFLLPMTLAWGAYRRSGEAWVWVAAFLTTSGSFLVELYADQYRLLSRLPGPVEPSAESGKRLPLPLRLLDAPFLRRFCGDHYFLISLLCVLDRVPLLLSLLAAAASFQILLQPLYYLVVLRRHQGVWAWQLPPPEGADGRRGT
jgi:phosphatidylglycerophosphate synthase